MGLSASPVSSEDKAVTRARKALKQHNHGLRGLLPFIGPAFIAAVAYVDPGNYATNIQSGSAFGYRLLWVVVLANLMAIFIQRLSAKLGIATGKNLPELCRAHFPTPINIGLWVFAEIAAMATDLAEFLGASLGLNLLFHIPLIVATVITGVGTYLILMLDRFGFRPLERFITAMVVLMGVCYLAETIVSHPSFSQIAVHSVVPWLGNSQAVTLAVGVIGATVMPHAVYLHSGLTQQRILPRNDEEKIQINRFSTKEIVIALVLAGLINMSMMYMAAAAFHSTGHTHIADIQSAYQTLTPLLGPAASAVFLVSLLTSGFSSSAVGTMAGQVIMQGFVGFTIPLWARRLVTMLPTVIVVWIGLDPTRTLVISQVILSLVLPLPIFSLVYFTRRRELMGVLVNRPITTVIASVIAGLVFVLNIILILGAFGVNIL
ncbi:Nramp family divalent metal transporter [Alicyclobacillus acidoterrestris]|uniref:Divalent metal cation transporter MntH n=1 Tax=Alicyclobacillus acidoterrestris (strain ATCC 49025 / DSM 3922 / CIP 106132 / NCIMB 13137 / GD3B) TaxID=1356854 RepID=T0CYP4_ALIAG|nr:Nramp family divalent metal transporter [Alicyclobacillus acidoterrestris]EPZ42671.1 hypothetical protein N007_14645 [Alicyclobacillus acidoterrestris ATCC 49025]UNO47390.1 Nramp family divalent metal transporter [Alicyclobacillus acidoterrestris]